MSLLRKQNVGRLLVLLLLIGAILLVSFSPLHDYFTLKNARTMVGELRKLWYGPLLFGLLFIVGCVLIVPASVFVLSAGVIWGWKLGGLYALISGALGAMASYGLGSYMGAGVLERFGAVGQRVTRQVERAGFSSLLVMRLVPVFPFALLNYGSGVAGVPPRVFAGATLFGMAPSIFIFAYSADALFNGTMKGEDAFKRLLIVGTLLAALVLLPNLIKRLRARGIVDPELIPDIDLSEPDPPQQSAD